MPAIVSFLVVALAGAYLIALAGAALFFPDRTRTFLRGFATSAARHYSEMVARLVVGVALLHLAAASALPVVFLALGWLLIVTTTALLVLPWQRHRALAERLVPPVLHHLPWLAAASLTLGTFLLLSLLPQD